MRFNDPLNPILCFLTHFIDPESPTLKKLQKVTFELQKVTGELRRVIKQLRKVTNKLRDSYENYESYKRVTKLTFVSHLYFRYSVYV